MNDVLNLDTPSSARAVFLELEKSILASATIFTAAKSPRG